MCFLIFVLHMSKSVNNTCYCSMLPFLYKSYYTIHTILQLAFNSTVFKFYTHRAQLLYLLQIIPPYKKDIVYSAIPLVRNRLFPPCFLYKHCSTEQPYTCLLTHMCMSLSRVDIQSGCCIVGDTYLHTFQLLPKLLSNVILAIYTPICNIKIVIIIITISLRPVNI